MVEPTDQDCWSERPSVKTIQSQILSVVHMIFLKFFIGTAYIRKEMRRFTLNGVTVTRSQQISDFKNCSVITFFDQAFLNSIILIDLTLSSSHQSDS